MAQRIVILRADIPKSGVHKALWIKYLRDVFGTESMSLITGKQVVDTILEHGFTKFLLEDHEKFSIEEQIFQLEDRGYKVETDPDSDPKAALRKAAIAYLLQEEDAKAMDTMRVLMNEVYGAAYA